MYAGGLKIARLTWNWMARPKGMYAAIATPYSVVVALRNSVKKMAKI